MAEATRKLLWDEYEEQVEVPEGDLWDFESQGGLMHPEEIEDPRTRWSTLARAELADYPQALARVLEAIAGYEPPEHPGPYWPPEKEAITPATDPESSDLELLELLRDRSGLN